MNPTQVQSMIQGKLQELNDRKMRPIIEQIAVETARIKAAQQNIVELQKQARNVEVELNDTSKALNEAFIPVTQ